MVNDLPIEYLQGEVERNAFNAAFYDLGFRWYWDSHTYYGLLEQCADAAERIRRYVETQQAHLLKAYDANFLVQVIQEKMAPHRQRLSAPGALATGQFDWAQTLGAELGT